MPIVKKPLHKIFIFKITITIISMIEWKQIVRKLSMSEIVTIIERPKHVLRKDAITQNCHA